MTRSIVRSITRDIIDFSSIPSVRYILSMLLFSVMLILSLLFAACACPPTVVAIDPKGPVSGTEPARLGGRLNNFPLITAPGSWDSALSVARMKLQIYTDTGGEY